jgi:hypothetical protein
MEFLLKKIINEFEYNGLLKEKLIFECYSADDDKMACYCYYLEDGSFHEIRIINENICYFREMTIKQLFAKKPFYVNHRFFTKLDPIAEQEFQCENLITFRIVDTKEWHDTDRFTKLN